MRSLGLVAMAVSASLLVCAWSSLLRAQHFEGLGDLAGGGYFSFATASAPTAPWWWASAHQLAAKKPSAGEGGVMVGLGDLADL